MAQGLLLERLFVRVDSEYDGRGMREAERDIDKVDDGVKNLNKTLNMLTAALGAAALAGLHAFTGWDRQLSTLAIKAGMTRREFDKMYGSASGAIARQTGAERAIIAESLQRSHSLNVTGQSAIDLVQLAAVLQRENVADMRQAVEASIALSNQGLGTPLQMLEQITKGAQVGAGDMGDYFQAIKGVGGLGGALGVGSHEMIGAMAVLSSSAKSLREGETQFRNVMAAIMKPTNEAQKLLEERTGKTFDEIQTMLGEENGLFKYLEMIRDTFDPKEFIKVTGTQEGALGMTALINEIATLAQKSDAVLKSQGVVAAIDADSGSDFSTALDKLARAFGTFVEAYGKPFATMLKPAVVALSALLGGIVTLNESTDGLLMWIPALITSILALRLALIASRRAFAFARPILGRFFGGGTAAGIDGKDGKDRNGRDGLGRSLGQGAAQGAAAAATGGGLYGAFKWSQMMWKTSNPKLWPISSENPGLKDAIRGTIRGLRALATVANAAKAGLASLFGWLLTKTDQGEETMGRWDDPAIDQKQNAILHAEWIRFKANWNSFFGMIGEKWDALNDWINSVAADFFNIDLSEIIAFRAKFSEGMSDLIGAIVDVLTTIYWAITNPLDAATRFGKWYITGGLRLWSELLGAIFNTDEDPAAAAAGAQADAAAQGAQFHMDENGNLLLNGQPIGSVTPATPAPTGGGSQGQAVINNNIDVDVDAKGATADDGYAIGNAVKNGVGGALQELGAQRIYNNAESFQIGG